MNKVCVPIKVKPICPPEIRRGRQQSISPVSFYFEVTNFADNDKITLSDTIPTYAKFVLQGIRGNLNGEAVLWSLRTAEKKYTYGNVLDNFRSAKYFNQIDYIYNFPAPIVFEPNTIMYIDCENKSGATIPNYNFELIGVLIPYKQKVKVSKELRIIGFYGQNSIKINEDIFIVDIIDTGESTQLSQFGQYFSNDFTIFHTFNNRKWQLDNMLLKKGIIENKISLSGLNLIGYVLTSSKEGSHANNI